MPSVAIVSQAFEGMANAISKAMGTEQVGLAIYPGVIPVDDDQTFHRKMVSEVVPSVITGLTNPVPGSHSVDTPPASDPRREVFVGDYHQVFDHYLEQGWTDGLPIVPPTVEHVEAFLAHTPRDPDEVLGTLWPSCQEATVWSVAVNGSMAGCRPEYLPLLIATVEAIADPAFRVQDAGSTPGWEPLVTVSGPVVDQLGFNAGTGVLRMGRQANTSVGRFVRLYLRNVAGIRIPPDHTDQAAIGASMTVALAEDDAATAAAGWVPSRVANGFGADDSVVTVRGVVSASTPIYTAGAYATDHLGTIARVFSDTIGPWCCHSYVYGASYPLLVLCPSIAQAIAADGLSRSDVKQFLYDNLLIDGDWVERYARGVSGKDFSWARLAAEGKAPDEYADRTTGDPRVRQLLDPSWTELIVAGNPGRNQSRAFVGNHQQGAPAHRVIETSS